MLCCLSISVAFILLPKFVYMPSFYILTTTEIQV